MWWWNKGEKNGLYFKIRNVLPRGKYVLKLFYPLMFINGKNTSKQSLLKLSYTTKLHAKDYGDSFPKI